jgi:shikimate dehydrogenase
LNRLLAGLIGHPVQHSISPRFQQAAFDALRISAEYQLWDTPAEGLAIRVKRLRSQTFLGANVTIPHKQQVLGLVDHLDPSAEAAGAANTIVNRGGRLEGYNTDIGGFARALRSELKFEVRGCRVGLLGAGGTARAVITALSSEGASSVVILNRSSERARQLVDEMRRRISTMLEWGPLDGTAKGALAGCDLVVNCTSVGLAGSTLAQQMPLPVESLPDSSTVVDVIANPLETPLLANARRVGHRTLGGLPMLVHQGALSFELWTDREAPLETMMAAALEAMQVH